MLPKDIKQNGAHELLMNTYVVVGQWYYYIDEVLLQTWEVAVDVVKD